jgi:sugar O-acyltransferase (sialic acid O-acetyltransferase NeuD family)
MDRVQVAIVGCGGFAREVQWALEHSHTWPSGEKVEVVGYVDREADPAGLHGLPVWTLEEMDRDIALVCGIGGMPEIKQRAMQEAESLGFRAAPPIVFDGSHVGSRVELGEGTLVCAGNIVTVDISLGRHVALNLDCTIGHDTIIEDFCTLSPGCHISGHVTMRQGAYGGTGCAVIEGREIGRYSVIGAGAVVTKDVPERSVAVGVPAGIKKTGRSLVCDVMSEQPA